MRQLLRGCVTVWYAHLRAETEGRDGDGLDTLEPVQVWSEPEALLCFVTGASGGWNGAETGEYKPRPFGLWSDFVRTLYYTGPSCPLQAGDRVWVERSTDQPHDYEAVRVTGRLGEWTCGLREVRAG